MTHDPRRAHARFRTLALVALAVLLVVTGLLSGCGKQQIDVPPVSTERPPEPQKPKNADLSTPEAAVTSYLDYVTYAYRLANSDVASQTMSPEELVRVDSYIELDRQRGRTIDQRLDSMKFGTAVKKSATEQLIPAKESWTYRYVDNLSGTYQGSAKQASFDATYTVQLGPTGWLVTSVEATSAAPVQ